MVQDLPGHHWVQLYQYQMRAQTAHRSLQRLNFFGQRCTSHLVPQFPEASDGIELVLFQQWRKFGKQADKCVQVWRL